MRVGIVGGLERAEPLYQRLAEREGHEAVLHDGHLAGRGAETLARLVDRCDVVVILTDVNSHGAVRFARERLRRSGRAPLLLRRFGLARFATLLAALNARQSVAV
jgi:hypothetical protein